MRIIEVQAKSIITSSKLPDADLVINPYTGCAFACSYCYASFMGRFVNEPIEQWGEYVYVKTNAVELARAELGRMRTPARQQSVLLSSVTDPYQGAEAKYRLTRGILGELVAVNYPGRVGILTKSPLVRRDIDLLKELQNAEVGFTITTTDDEISRWLEMRAPAVSARMRALGEVTSAGLETYAFVGPLLPHFLRAPDLLDALFAGIAGAGVREVYIEHMNLRGYIRERLDQRLAGEETVIRDAYQAARTKEHRAALNQVIEPLLQRHGLHLRLGQVLYHNGNRREGRRDDASTPTQL